MASLPRRSLAAVAALVVLAVGAPADAAPSAADRTHLETTVAYIQRFQNADGGFGSRPGSASDDSMTDDVVFALACMSVNPLDQARPGGVDAYTFMERQSAGLRVTTDYDRALLVTNAAGADPHDFGGVDLVAELERRQLPNGAWPHERGGTAGGMNDTAFAVLGLALVDEPGIEQRRDRALDWLEGLQRPDGSWPLSARGDNVSTDLAGAALQALATDHRSGPAVDKTLEWLQARQNDDGGWSQLNRGSESNTMSTAWVVQGLVAAGVDPERWTQPGGDPLRFLARMQRDDGSIRYSPSDTFSTPIWTTAQVAPAFAGQPLPIGAVPRKVRAPEPTATGAPAQPQASGVGGSGQGGTGTQSGAGVVAGGGGSGAPLFSRPQPQSKGKTAGGVREVDPTPTPAASATAAPGAPGQTPSPTGIAQSNGTGSAGVTPRRTGGGDSRTPVDAVPSTAPGAPSATDPVTGTLIGQDAASGGGDGQAAAPGLLASKRGDPTSPVPALVLAGLLLVAAGSGWRVERDGPRQAVPA